VNKERVIIYIDLTQVSHLVLHSRSNPQPIISPNTR